MGNVATVPDALRMPIKASRIGRGFAFQRCGSNARSKDKAEFPPGQAQSVVKRLLATAIVLCAASAARGQAAPSAALQPGVHPAVVRVVAPERDGASYGSGTLVAVNEAHGLVVTNWHVVRDAYGPLTVIFPDGSRFGATVLRTDRDWDLAALAIRRPHVPPIPLAATAPQPGEMLTIAGYGKGWYRTASGQCTQYVSPGGNLPFEMVELAAPAREGDSGGPIFNSRGELAGVLFGAAFGRTTGSYCGRVNWFLASVAGNFQRLSAEPAMIAHRPRPEVAPLAAIAGQTSGPEATRAATQEPPRLVSTDVTASSAQPQPTAGAAASAVAVQPTPPIVPEAAPRNLTEQLKLFLAVVGVVFLLLQAVRLLGWAVG